MAHIMIQGEVRWGPSWTGWHAGRQASRTARKTIFEIRSTSLASSGRWHYLL